MATISEHSMKVPGFAEEVLSRLDQSTVPLNKAQVYHALTKARAEHPVPDDEKEGMDLETSTFFFFERRRNKSIWGTYFSPGSTKVLENGTEVHFPDAKKLGPEAVAHWEGRARRAKHPVLRARYADLAWDLGPMITGQQSNTEFAAMAIDAYLDAVDRGFPTRPMDGVDWCQRALDLSLALGDEIRIRHVVNSMFELHREASPENIGVCVFLFDDLYERPFLQPDEETTMIARLEEMLAQTSDPENLEFFNPFGADAAAERLGRHYERIGAIELRKKVIVNYGRAFEFAAANASPLVAMAWLQPVIDKYLEVGLRADAERAQRIALERQKTPVKKSAS